MFMVVNALSIDVEDYFHTVALQEVVARKDWEKCEARVAGNTLRLLELLAAYGVRATFFVLGWVAERDPHLVKRIHAAGHEVACHGYDHQLIYRLSPEEFRRRVYRAKDVLEQLIGAAVKGFRACTFSIRRDTLWALDILIEAGFTYDSSIFPIAHDRYGIPDAERFPHKIQRPGGCIYEFPLSTVRCFGMNLPLAGGGYLRLLPYAYTSWGIRRLNRKGRPVVVYTHPWEIDPAQPRLPVSWLIRLRHYTNLGGMERRLKKLLREFRFAPLAEVLGL